MDDHRPMMSIFTAQQNNKQHW